MSIVLVISLLIPIIYLGYIISKLDKFLEGGGFKNESDEAPPCAVVLGQTDLAKEVTELLEAKGISVILLTEPFIFEQEKRFYYMFALSESDADNMVLCKIGKKLFSIEKMISLCNDLKNENVFRSEKIRYLVGKDITAQILYEIVQQKTEVRGE